MLTVMKVLQSKNPSGAMRRILEFREANSACAEEKSRALMSVVISQKEQFPEVLLALAVLSLIKTIPK